MNARFWTMAHGQPVKVTLRPGQSLHFHYGGSTDEGWASYAERLHHTGDGVLCEMVDDGRDCDGRLTRYSTFHCDLDKLHSGCEEEDWGIVWPAWKSVGSHQRDEYAEMMGY